MSSINQLLGTHAYLSSQDNDTININESNLLCIDTSNNRIGINTLDPSYSIHVENNENENKNDSSIYSYNIIIPNKLDVSYIEVSNNVTIHNKLDVSYIEVSNNFKLINSNNNNNNNSNMEIYYLDNSLNVILNNLPHIDNSNALPDFALYYDVSGFVKIKI